MLRRICCQPEHRLAWVLRHGGATANRTDLHRLEAVTLLDIAQAVSRRFGSSWRAGATAQRQQLLGLASMAEATQLELEPAEVEAALARLSRRTLPDADGLFTEAFDASSLNFMHALDAHLASTPACARHIVAGTVFSKTVARSDIAKLRCIVPCPLSCSSATLWWRTDSIWRSAKGSCRATLHTSAASAALRRWFRGLATSLDRRGASGIAQADAHTQVAV